MTTKTAAETGNAVIYNFTGKGHKINVASDVWPLGDFLEIHHRIKAGPSSFSNNNYSTIVFQATLILCLSDFEYILRNISWRNWFQYFPVVAVPIPVPFPFPFPVLDSGFPGFPYARKIEYSLVACIIWSRTRTKTFRFHFHFAGNQIENRQCKTKTADCKP